MRRNAPRPERIGAAQQARRSLADLGSPGGLLIIHFSRDATNFRDTLIGDALFLKAIITLNLQHSKPISRIEDVIMKVNPQSLQVLAKIEERFLELKYISYKKLSTGRYTVKERVSNAHVKRTIFQMIQELTEILDVKNPRLIALRDLYFWGSTDPHWGSLFRETIVGLLTDMVKNSEDIAEILEIMKQAEINLPEDMIEGLSKRDRKKFFPDSYSSPEENLEELFGSST